jgi:hypothetical protein
MLDHLDSLFSIVKSGDTDKRMMHDLFDRQIRVGQNKSPQFQGVDQFPVSSSILESINSGSMAAYGPLQPQRGNNLALPLWISKIKSG